MNFKNIFDLDSKKIRIFDLIIIILLVIICYNQFTLVKILRKNFYTNLIGINNLRRNIDFDKEEERFFKNINNTKIFIDKIIKDNEKMFNNLNKDYIKFDEEILNDKQEVSKATNVKSFRFYPKTEINDKEFIFTMRLPKDFDKSKLNVSFDKKVLSISFEESQKNENSRYYSAFTREFFVDTKATAKDLVKTIENNILKVIIPIIK